MTPAPAESVQADAAAVRPPDIRVEQTPVLPAAEPPAGTPIPADTHQLVFTFQGKSWVEVKDASQRVVFSAENAPGTRQVVGGKPPFQVVIGNATQVEVQYDDRQVDLKPHIRAEVARLTIE
jgi:cytoskeleton protein RodZ